MERPPELDQTRAAGPRAAGGAGAWEPPAEFEEYRLVRPLGQGAMGRVFVAHDLLLDRLVAVKFVADDAPSDSGRERFFVEARALARLQHPNIVAVHRVGEVRRRPYLVSELLRGRTLGELAAPLPPAEVLRIGVGLARGLAAAHRRGVLHRDIKPHNAMVTEEGEVKLLDFGLAKLLDGAPEPAPPGPGAAGAAPVGRAEPAGAAAGPAEGRPSPALTQQGALVGSPLYLAPELWRGGAAPSRQSDVYSLGVVLYELCAGRPPFSGATLEELRERVLAGGAAPLPAGAPMAAELAAVIDRCLRLDPAERPGSGDALREALERLAAPPPLVPAGNPYRGLLRFEAEHRGLFFGRGAEVRAVLDRLREGGFVLVAGDSGVGKSSLCRAGVLPACEEGALGAPLQSLRVTPGRRPLQALCAAVAPLLAARPGGGEGEEQLLRALREDPAQLGRRLRQLAPPPLLFVDQLEELVTLSDPEEAAACAAALCAVAESGGRLLCTARADFLSRLCGLPALGAEVPRALWLLSPLSDDGLREAVEGPARAKGYAFEETALVDELAAAGRGGALPLLQFALAELWEARDEGRRLLTVSSLQTLGGVGGALGRHADGVLRRMLPQERICARRLLLALVTADGTRSRKDARELLGGAPEPAAVAALDALVQGRLLLCSAAEEPGEAGAAPAVYELAHEALLSGWEMLGRWLTGDAELRALRQRLSYAAGEWRRLGGSEEALWRERQLREAQVLRDGDLQSREVAFVAASRRAVERGRWRRRLPLALVPLLLALGVALFQIAERRQVGRRVASLRAQALARLGEARGAAGAAAARREAALRRFDEGARATGEADWGASLTQEAEADRGYGRAAQLLESALQLDGPRQDAAALRALLADVLSERAEGAARGQRPGQREELLDRLRLYDEGGARRARLLARARLTVESTPPATLRVELAAPAGGRRDFAALPGTAPSGEAARTPLTIELAPGTYRLTLSAPGRAEVRQVLRLLPGEARTESLPLPAAAAVPPGMIYVPAGAFLFGSAAEELRRGFLGTQPLRAARTGAFLIAQRETTFGDWIAFLRALPPSERARRRPRVGGPGMHGGLELREGPAGEFALSYQPTDEALSARAGEPLRYRGRAAHQSVDWLRLPVSGVDAEDAAAYAAWLRRGGRLPGARLCTEHEWERAARGADEREYPHGDRLEPDDANYDATHSGAGHGGLGLCEVGSHPASRSPFGVEDLAGNVWEWVVPVISRAPFMARGGGYYYGDVVQRSTNRHEPEPTLRDATVGLRVCADAP